MNILLASKSPTRAKLLKNAGIEFEIVGHGVDEEEVKFPYRVKLKSTKILPEKKYISGYDVAPSLNYVKRWAPEDWYLALLSPVHIILRKRMN